MPRWPTSLSSAFCRAGLRWLIFCLVVISVVGVRAAESPLITVPFDGSYPFRVGDDLAWKQPSQDDSSWSRVTLPSVWQAGDQATLGDIAWYRIPFQISEALPRDDLAVSLGYVGNTSEVFLNGKSIGQYGSLDPIALPIGRTLHVYLLPTALLRMEGTNVLAIRVANFVGTGGILDGPIGIGRQGPLLLEQMSVAKWRYLVTCLVTMVTFVLLVLLTLFLWRVRVPWGRWAWLFLGSMFLTYLTAAFFSDPPSPPAWYTCLSWSLATVAALAFTRMVGSYCRRSLPRIEVGLTIACVVSVVLVVWKGDAPVWYWPLCDLTGVFFLVCLAVSASCCWQEIADGRRYAVGLAIGVVCLYVGSLIDAISGSIPLYACAASSIAAWEIGFFIALPIVGGVFVMQFLDDRKRLQTLGHQILNEREAERRRLAQDLHDGLGQSLQALKVMMQVDRDRSSREAAEPRADSPDRIEQLSQCIRELRLLAREMHPAVSRDISFYHLMEAYAGDVSDQFGVTVSVVAKDPEMGLRWRDDFVSHCFLIFKEAIGNAIRHGRARSIVIRLWEEGPRVHFVVSDDGRGFDVAGVLEKSQGLGLRSIQERVAYLRGLCRFESDPGQGSQLTIELDWQQS